MSKRLNQAITDYLGREGKVGKLRLALAISRGERMIDRYWHGKSIPTRDTALKIALQCGLSEVEARDLAGEYSITGRRSA